MGSFAGLFGRTFGCLSLIFVATVVLVILSGTDASIGNPNSNNGNSNGIKLPPFEVYNLPAIQWACEPFFNTKYDTERNENSQNLNPMKEKTRELCLKLRGGGLGNGVGSNDFQHDSIVIDNNKVEGSAENHNSSLEESSLDLTEEEKQAVIEMATLESESSSTTTLTSSATETEEEAGCELYEAIALGNDDPETVASQEDEPESDSEERNYVPSAAPTVSGEDTKSKYTFSILQENDGHETDPDGIPSRYLKMQGDRRDLAKAAFEKTVEWRKENDIDTILSRPHPKFDVSKAVFPHYFCGRDDTQHVILLQRPGLMNVDIAHKNNLSGEDLLLHYIYVMEYLWRIVDPLPEATMTSIIDLTEMNMSILRKREQLRIGSLFLSTMDAHFPQRSYRTYLINAPKWFGALYKLASPLLRESTKEKISILSKGKEQDEVLKQLLRDCPIPEDEKLENVPAGIMEEELRNFCLARLDEAGVAMQPVEPVKG
mmetsp:Transcript_16459/g.33823  ORF Transcript_16459/g.33823 Transcript_16459/m.33823 type:complete len:488 (+) Transcript_16459:86-1549(+)